MNLNLPSPLSKTQSPIRLQKQRRRRILNEMQDKRNESRAMRMRQFQNKLNAQIKYLDDKKEERRKEREAQQQQGSFIQIIRQLFNFSKAGNKSTQ